MTLDQAARDPWRAKVRTLTGIGTSECRRLLAAASTGRVGMVHDGAPVVVPVQYVFDGRDVFYRTRRGGLLDPGPDHRDVAVEIDGTDTLYHLGWSVLLRGIAQRIEQPAGVPVIRPWIRHPESCTIHVATRSLTGRRIVDR